MKKIITFSIIGILAAGTLTSCSETRKRATDQLDQFNREAENLNSAVDEGFKKIETIDSVVRTGSERIKEYDSLVKNGSSKIDSIAKKKAEAWKELTEF